MKLNLWLLRLMHRVRLTAQVQAKLGPEDRLAIEVADACRAWTLEGRLQALWWHTPNEGGGANRRKAQIELAVKTALGLIQGAPDLVFIGYAPGGYDAPANHHQVLMIELKSKTGTLTENQKDFRSWAESAQIDYRIAKTFEQVEAALLETGLLTPMPKGSTAHADQARS